MKYNVFLPLSALVALSLLSILVSLHILPPGQEILENITKHLDSGFYFIVFIIILLESILYVGFYFPGQFFAVVLVVGANPSPLGIAYMTIAMVLAATLGSGINFFLGKRFGNTSVQSQQTKLKHLLLAMIHINSLAFFMFAQGADNKSSKVILFAGLLNLPYYLLLIAGTAILSEQVMAMAENPYFLFTAVFIWLIVAAYFDFKKAAQKNKHG
ncbi:DedA family protein [Agaribacter flavus]|uniref:DedA family protein n=1 Tax=Agaribacter flavus TaxID=1902781 RepID=A0ABV7FK11_9ALTE